MPTYDYQCDNDQCLCKTVPPKEYLLPMNHEPPRCEGCGAPMVMRLLKPPSMSMGQWVFYNPRPNPEEL